MTVNALSHQPALATKSVVGSGFSSEAGGAEFYQPVDIHRALNEVRQMPEFQPHQPGWLDEFWKLPWVKRLSHQAGDAIHQVLKSIGNVLSHLKLPGLSHLPGNLHQMFTGFVGFILVLVCLFALYLFLGWLLRFREQKLPAPSPQPRLLEQVVLVNSGHHYRQALTEAEKSDYEAALKQLYMATLCLLDERKIAPYEANRTNLEYQSLLDEVKGVAQKLTGQSRLALKACFIRVARQFEAVRYGLRPVSQGQFEHSCADYEEMQTMLARID